MRIPANTLLDEISQDVQLAIRGCGVHGRVREVVGCIRGEC